MAKPKNPTKMSRDELAAYVEKAHAAAKKARSTYNKVLRLLKEKDSAKK
jgi:hypothetical protein